MSQTAKTTAAQTQTTTTPAASTTQVAPTNTQDSVKDAGRVHIGGGVIVF